MLLTDSSIFVHSVISCSYYLSVSLLIMYSVIDIMFIIIMSMNTYWYSCEAEEYSSTQ